MGELNSFCDFSNYLDHNSSMASYEEKYATGRHSSFNQISIMHWGPQNCMEWGIHICNKYNLDKLHIDIGIFNQIDGSQLMNLTDRKFCSLLGDQYGMIFYDELNKLKKNMFTEVQNRYPNSDHSRGIDHSNYCINLDPYIPNMDTYATTYSYPQNLQSSNASEFQLNGNLEYFKTESQDIWGSSDKTWDIPEESLDEIGFSDLSIDLKFDVLSLGNEIIPDKPARVKRKSGDRQTKSRSNREEVLLSDGCVENVIRKMPGVANRDRCPRNWEFLMRLLVNTETNPSVIRWEDESQYIFRLVNPESIVQIWNNKSETSTTNFYNFARSLRYHYKKGILISVPAKQLVYQCGTKAILYLNNLRKL